MVCLSFLYYLSFEYSFISLYSNSKFFFIEPNCEIVCGFGVCVRVVIGIFRGKKLNVDKTVLLFFSPHFDS